MYVSVRNPPRQSGRGLRAYSQLRGPGLGRLRGRGLGQDSFDWSSVITTGINDAASVARIAVQPVPTVTTLLPGGGTQVATYPVGTTTNQLLGASGLSGESLLSSPLILLLGGGLLLVLVMSRKN